MAEVILNCPQCQRSLRVTDELLGQLVKCPACGATFTVSSGQREPTPSEPQEVLPADSPSPQGHRPDFNLESPEATEEDHDQARAYVIPAAVCLMVVGLSGILFDFGQAVFLSIITEATWEKLPRDFIPDVPLDQLRGPGIVVGSGGGIVASIVVIASIQMIRLRMYPLAILASLLAMINCVNFCCIPGLPLGLWSLIVLLRPDVRAAFH